jgi:hypothetical protein
MPQKKTDRSSGAWPQNPQPAEQKPTSPGETIDIDDRDEGYQVAGAGDAPDFDDEDTLDLGEEESDEEPDDDGTPHKGP